MFERFTDRARRVVVLAQDEARALNHDYIGTEHLLLGLIQEGEGVAAKALAKMQISLEDVRSRVEEAVGQGRQAPSGHIPFTPRAKKTLELSLRESLQLGHDYIGTEHILLGLLREGDGVAAQVLVGMGADLNRVRHEVVLLLEGYQGGEAASSPVRRTRIAQDFRLTEVQNTLAVIMKRLTVIERHLGLTAPGVKPTDQPAAPGEQAAAGDQPAPGGKPAAAEDNPESPDDKQASGE
jgi:ATP-dependent Clp protease ATP-binding subunit ClpA